MIIGLTIILILVLILPFTKLVERNLEVFLFIMGVLSVFVSQMWSWDLVKEALIHPINITLAVLVAGLLFRWFQNPIEKGVIGISRAMPFPLFIGLFVIIIGLISSIITAIVAAIILVFVISILKMDRKSEILVVILACYAIGMGAALTPIGEPLSTIVVNSMKEDFFYLLELIGPLVIPGVIVLGIVAALVVRRKEVENYQVEQESESYGEIVIRSVKIYLFVFGLTMLGAGFEPLINAYLLDLDAKILYWINILSAVLDNATLAAAEISPAMTPDTVEAILMGLIVAGGMLIPGNIPNIISAGKLNITSKEWAKIGLPMGFVLLIIYFIILILMGL